MASQQRHIDQWKHNRQFLATIAPEYPDWIVTGTFYVALHAVDALVAHHNERVVSHQSRNDLLLRTNRYLFIRKQYMPLYDLARTVRYLADPRQWVPFERVQKDVIQRYLLPLEGSVQKGLGVDLGWPPILLTLPAAAPQKLAEDDRGTGTSKPV